MIDYCVVKIDTPFLILFSGQIFERPSDLKGD